MWWRWLDRRLAAHCSGRRLRAAAERVIVSRTSGRSQSMLRSSLVGIAAVAMGCASVPPMRSGPLLDQYARATCVPARRVSPGYIGLEWAQVIQGPSGCTARVVGARSSTGGVSVEYPPDTTRYEVAAFGEKSNPLDVRVDLGSCRLYVSSYGSPLFVKETPTWLVEYDLRQRRELQAVKVEPEVLPSECPESPGAG